MLLIVVTLCIIALVILYHMVQTSSYTYKMVEKMHGPLEPRPLPILGNSHLFSADSSANYNLLLKFAETHKRIFRIWLGGQPYVFGYNVKDAETLFSSTTHITKSDAYKFTLPWIGTGLLTSTGAKWKSRRRIITPTFHFKILEDFVDVFEANAQILVDKLEKLAGLPAFDVYPFCNLFALDNICETAMGVHVNAQIDSDSKYVKAIKDMCKIVNVRVYQPWLAYDFIFNLSSWGAMQKNALGIIHGQTTNTIKERRKLIKNTNHENSGEQEEKKKLAFLDLLLESSEAASLTDEDIREEVDTFMFEGHDTVTSGISFALYSLSQNPVVQEKLYQEQLEIFGDSNRQGTFKDYQEMKYLERVLKESQRLYPSVPIIGRYLESDLNLSDGVVVPKGVQMHFLLPLLHRNPSSWNDPETFNPDNFLPEVSSKRSPYAYVPFSAGPRNCIGQKFALMEMKACLSAIVRKFKLLPCAEKEKISLVAEIVLLSKTGINLRLAYR